MKNLEKLQKSLKIAVLAAKAAPEVNRNNNAVLKRANEIAAYVAKLEKKISDLEN